MAFDASKAWEARPCQDRSCWHVWDGKESVGVFADAEAAVLVARAHNAAGIQTRRRWGVACDADGFRATATYKQDNPDQRITEEAYPDPATAVIEADRWYRERFEGGIVPLAPVIAPKQN
jgi:hypothetical protein